MTSFARVSAGVVVELFDALPVFTPELMATIHPCGSNVASGWTWDGQTFSAPPGPTLAEVKAARRAEISALYAQKLAAGMAYQGKTLQVDEDSQLRIIGAAAAAGMVSTVPAVGWRMADNTFLPLPNAAAMIALGQAAAAYVEGLRARMWAHKDAIAALPDAAAVAAYDIAAGW
jgi:hypothetical protein